MFYKIIRLMESINKNCLTIIERLISITEHTLNIAIYFFTDFVEIITTEYKNVCNNERQPAKYHRCN
jgi:hypothetical protein